MSSNHMKFGVGIALIILAVVWLGFSGFQEGKSYYVTLQELKDMGDNAYNKKLRVAGDVEKGSIVNSGSSIKFTLIQKNFRLPIDYLGRDPLPDTFKDGTQAVVEGTYEKDGVFRADFIQAKCASKYEADQ